MMHDARIKQRWQFDTIDPRTGIILARQTKLNTITDQGLALLARLVIGTGAGKYYSHCAIGEGATLETSADSQLISELDREPTTAPTSYGGVARITTRFTHSGSNTLTISEAGLFDAASGGNLLARVTTTSPVELASNKALTITITIAIGGA